MNDKKTNKMKIYKELKRVVIKEYIDWAWINELDADSNNTLDAYITQLEK